MNIVMEDLGDDISWRLECLNMLMLSNINIAEDMIRMKIMNLPYLLNMNEQLRYYDNIFYMHGMQEILMQHPPLIDDGSIVHKHIYYNNEFINSLRGNVVQVVASMYNESLSYTINTNKLGFKVFTICSNLLNRYFKNEEQILEAKRWLFECVNGILCGDEISYFVCKRRPVNKEHYKILEEVAMDIGYWNFINEKSFIFVVRS